MADFEEMVPERYKINYSKEGGVFRILDSWHPIIKNLKLEENPTIPDDSPAIKVISTEEVNAIVGELLKLGWLDRIIQHKDGPELPKEVQQRSKTLHEIALDNIKEIVLNTATSVGADKDVAKEGITSIREIMSRGV